MPDTSKPHTTSALPEVHSAGGVVINEEGRVLFCHPTRSRWSNWRMPKGRIDDGEDMKACALREVREETGYECTAIVKLKTTPKYRSGDAGKQVMKVVHLWLMHPVGKVQKPDWEMDAFRWIEFDEVEKYAARVELDVILEAIEAYKARIKN